MRFWCWPIWKPFKSAGEERFAKVARDILNYVSRDMLSEQGAFYSATDADSLTPTGHREEGWYFTWTPAELTQCLGEKAAAQLSVYYQVSEGGNFEGRSILHTPKPLSEVAAQLGVSVQELSKTIEDSRPVLLAERNKRPLPILDDKILTAWNGLMIQAYAKAALVLGEEHFAARAAKAADFVLSKMRVKGRLQRSYKDGNAKHNAYLEDYSFMIAGLLELYQASSEPRWLKAAIDLDEELSEHYEDKDKGAFFMTSHDHETLIAREKPVHDGATPSGNSVQAMNLARLHAFTTLDSYRQRLEKLFKALGGSLKSSPAAHAELLLAVDFMLGAPKEVFVVQPKGTARKGAMLDTYRQTFWPASVFALINEDDLAEHTGLLPALEGKKAMDGKATAYVCEQGRCKLPTTDPELFLKQLTGTVLRS